MSIVADNAEPERVYRPRARGSLGWPGAYLTLAVPGTAKRLVKRFGARVASGAITGAELSQYRAALAALEGKAVLLVLHRRWTESDGTKRESHTYVQAARDYELRELKSKPG